jgi:hypothetical protein
MYVFIHKILFLISQSTHGSAQTIGRHTQCTKRTTLKHHEMKQAGNKTNKVEEMLLNLKVMIRITLMLDEITQSNIQVQGLR